MRLRHGFSGTVVAALVVSSMASLVPAPTAASDSATIERLAGADRYATAAAISRATFPTGVAVAYVATGLDFPDSLAAGPAAARNRAPILLTKPDGLPTATRDELVRLQPASIVILGGPGAVRDAVASELAPLTRAVRRVAGADRYATAAAISAATFPAGVPIAYIATGRSFPDALSAGAAAARLGGPLLLVAPDAIPGVVRTELTRLRPARIVVTGGTAVVNAAVMQALDAYTAGAVSRQAGSDRFATSAAISAAAFPAAPTAFLANGLGFADAVAGIPAAAKAGAPMLLTLPGALPLSIATELRRLDPARVVLLGGPAAISDSIRAAVAAATALVRVGPHYFSTDGYTLQSLPDDLLAFNGATVIPLYGDRDATGAFIYQAADGKWYDHPVGQAQYVVNMLRNFRLDPNPTYLDLAIANGNRLLQRAVRFNGGIFFPYPFDFTLHGRGVMRAPWYSGMAQGIALSGFVRLFQVTGDARWKQAADDTLASFKVARQPGKPWFAVVESGNLWFEEYPWVPYDHTFNGHNFATYGLIDYWRLTGSVDAQRLAIGAISTSARVAGTVRVPGGISQYCIAQSCLDRKVRNPNYHLTHIGQFIQLYRYTRSETFARLADIFTSDNPNFRIGGTVAFRAGTHVGYQFDSSGLGAPAATLVLASSSSAHYSQRTVPYGWIRPGNGIWFYMTDGFFAGLWIRESSSAYARGFVDRLEYYWPRPVAVSAGTRTGYQFDASGAITATQTVSASAATWEYVASAKINGTRAVLLSAGPLAGYWLPATIGTAGTAAAVSASIESAALGQLQRSLPSTAEVPPPPSLPDDPLIPSPMPGQQELAPESGPPPHEQSP